MDLSWILHFNEEMFASTTFHQILIHHATLQIVENPQPSPMYYILICVRIRIKLNAEKTNLSVNQSLDICKEISI